MDAANLFAGKSVVYRQSRPGYPAECFDYLLETAGVSAGDCAADVGAGTGLFTIGLLERGLRVYAVEPNDDMRREARQSLSAFPHCRVVPGAAEHTGLPAGSMALVTAAQAFHWFSAGAFQAECRRILRPDGFAALVWNRRDEKSPLTRENAAICREFCPDFRGFSGGMDDSSARYAAFFRQGRYNVQEFPHPLTYTRDVFVNRNLSSSYAPKPGNEAYHPFMEAVSALFSRYARDGQLIQPNTVCCYIGRV